MDYLKGISNFLFGEHQSDHFNFMKFFIFISQKNCKEFIDSITIYCKPKLSAWYNFHLDIAPIFFECSMQ